MLLTLNLEAVESIDLRGEWSVALDHGNIGRVENWFTKDLPGQRKIELPGSLQASRIGNAISTETRWTGSIFDRSWFTAPQYARYRQPGNIKVPFWLQPETEYIGSAWYQRTIEVPAEWTGKHVTVRLERPHWKTTVWIDGQELGSRDSLSVPHVFEVGTEIGAGRHRLTVRVDNTLDPDIGENSHSVSDHTQGNWNGIVGRIELVATATTWIDDLQVYPRFAERSVQVRGRVGSRDSALPKRVSIRVEGADVAIQTEVVSGGSFESLIPLGPDADAWDEFHPRVCHLTANLENGESRTVPFGLRELTTNGRRLEINGRPLFLRGTLDCAAYPRTGHPPMDVETWRTVLETIKAHGLNHVRFHSWCPPAAAFEAADELGLYLQIEAATWPNWSTTIGDGKPVDAWVDSETSRILREYGNHPSFALFACGNEPGGDQSTPWLASWTARHKQADPRHLFTASSAWPEIPENDYVVVSSPRIQLWSEGLKSRINAFPPETVTDYRDFIRARNVPVVSHEIGQWCVYPNFSEIPKYTGYLKARNFEIFRDSLEEHGMGEQAHAFMIASGKLQALCYKEDIESALRTNQMGGFQLLGLNDFPGQGTALVGVLDAFWEEKGYITPDEFKRFSGPTVPLARLSKRVFTTDEHLRASLEVAHFGAHPLGNSETSWKLVADDGTTAATGSSSTGDIPVGGGYSLGQVEIPLEEIAAPARYKLVVELRSESGNEVFENDWDVWVYPSDENVPVQPQENVLVAGVFDGEVRAKLEAGGTVMLILQPRRVAGDPERGPIALGFSSIFWNTAWTSGQAPHTLGILCDPKSPALAAFPTDSWSNWNWWYAVSNAAPMIMKGFPRDMVPIVQVIDDWVTNRRLALVFEARYGKGRILVTSVDLADAVLDPVRRQLRASLLAYVASDRFQPKVSVDREAIESLLAR